MAIKASATITLSFMIDIKATYRYYKLQSSTATAPSVPSTNPESGTPSGWDDTEPSYTSGSTNTLYFVDCTVFTNNTFLYTPVSKSSSYEAAKEAYNKAVAANNSATDANNKIDNLEIGGRNLITKDTVFRGTTNGYYCDFVRGGSIAYTADIFADMVGPNAGDIGETITISFDIILRDGGTSRALGIYAYQSSGVSIRDSFSATPTTEWQRVSYTTKVKRYAQGYYDNGNPYTDGEIYIWDFAGTNNYTIRNVKIERGTKATDWTPAPEDVQNNINDAQSSADEAKNTLDSMRSEMQYLKDAINALVGKDGSYSLLRVDENGTWSMNTTDLESISSLTELVEANRDSLSQAASDIETLVSSVDDLDTKTTYVYSGKTTYEDGTVEPWVELGRFDNGFKLTITNTRIVFFDGTETTTYFSNKALSTETLTQGDFQWQNRSNGNLGLKWIGVDI